MKISAVILTFNEEDNIANCLRSIKNLVDEIIIIDSFSTDSTMTIVNSFDNVKSYQRVFDNHTAQWNFGLSKSNYLWVLSLDADYVVSQKLFSEIKSLDLLKTKHSAFNISFKYCVHGKPLISSILPERAALFNIKFCTYVQDGHTQSLKVNGNVGRLSESILHDDRKKLERWLWAQNKYASLELEKLFDETQRLSFVDKLRKKVVFTPIIVFLYCFILKKGFLDGRHGVFYALQRAYAELLISIKIFDNKLSKTIK